MKNLTPSQLDQLNQALRQTRLNIVLQAEILDHLASEIERLMADGHAYEVALRQVMQEASPTAVDQLQQTYQQVLQPRPLRTLRNTSRIGRRHKRPAFSTQFRIWLQASVLAFLILLICLMWVSQLFALPLGLFGSVWVIALISLLGGLSARLLFQFRPRSRKNRLRLA